MKTGKTVSIAGISLATISFGATAFYYGCKKSPNFKKKADIAADKAIIKLFKSVKKLKNISNRKP